jgi:hypothetical protein
VLASSLFSSTLRLVFNQFLLKKCLLAGRTLASLLLLLGSPVLPDFCRLETSVADSEAHWCLAVACWGCVLIG